MKSSSLYILLFVTLFSASCSHQEKESKGELEALRQQIENQNKRLEQQENELESLRDSIGQLHNALDRCATHATHAETDVRQARQWASANGYGKTLGPYIDNVIYDLEAICQYSKGE